MMRIVIMLCGLWALMPVLPVQAHSPSDAFLTMSADSPRSNPELALSVQVLDLALELDLDADADGDIRWWELQAAQASIHQLIRQNLGIRAGEQDCPLDFQTMQLQPARSGIMLRQAMQAQCPPDAGPLVLEYSLFFQRDPQHRLWWQQGEDGQSRIIGPEDGPVPLSGGAMSGHEIFVQYLIEGVWHIWIGADHLLFLLSLILPVLLIWRQGRWRPRDSARQGLMVLLKVITAFTVAHSISLALAVFGWLTLPARGVEIVIAVSVLVVALNNIRPVFAGSRWTLALFFGFVHGFGFANVLRDLGLPESSMALALFGFNLGVELGQILAVAAVWPLLYAFYRRDVFARRLMPALSSLCALIALAWIGDRVSGWAFMPF